MVQQPELAAFTWPEHKAVRRQRHLLSKSVSRTMMNVEHRHSNGPKKLMTRPLPLRQGKGISSARRTGSSTHQSGSPKRTGDHRADASIVPTAGVVHRARLCIIDCISGDVRRPAYTALRRKRDLVSVEQEFQALTRT